MSEALSTQMNIRIGSESKARGDAAFAKLGYTASDVVRAIWELAAAGGEYLDMLLAPLAQGTILEQQSERDKERSEHRLTAIQEGPLLWERAVAQLPHGMRMERHVDYSDDELLEMAWTDRMQERGLV